MLDELRRYNNIGDVNGITYFIKLILNESRTQKSSAQKLCALRSNIRLNFPAAVSFIKYLEIVEEKVGYLYLTDEGKALAESTNLSFDLCKMCFEKAIVQELLNTSAIHYDIENEDYVIEKYGFSVSAALFRNILIQFGALKEQSGDLVISDKYENIFIEYQKKNKVGMSLEKLKKQLLNQEIQGELAEQFVLSYERKRLIGHPQIGKIKQISVIDVSAGYDILSFERVESAKPNRFIEVKSFQGNPHFYWSQNEIEAAKLYENNYFIYLVDSSKINEEGYEPRIIQNPAKNIIESDQWILNPTSYMVIPTD